MAKSPEEFSEARAGQPFWPRYKVVDIVGQGAAAIVYRVVDQKDGSVRAVKALRADSQDEPEVVRRFEEEYRILRRLHYPSLPEVYEYGFSAEGLRYMVMEYVRGEQLDTYLKANPNDLWLLLYELCEVLSFIHSHNLLHQDLKPANILVKRTGAYGAEKPLLMLMDFGLSYRRDVGEEVTLVGTPDYMAPEIIRGETDLTRAVDYYSIGITLYELLEGKTPFQGTVNEVFRGHLSEEVRFEREKTEYAELYPHVLGMLSKDRTARLEAFEDFRRGVAARIGGGVDELERAYGLGFIASIGAIGKKSAWDTISDWLDSINRYVTETTRAQDEDSEPSLSSVPDGDHRLRDRPAASGDEKSSFVSNLKVELLSKLPVAGGEKEPAVNTLAERPPIMLAISGASSSGKSYLLDDLKAQSHLGGRMVWVLGQRSEYELLVDGVGTGGVDSGKKRSKRKTASVPRPDTLSRFMKGWDRLVSAGESRGAMLIVDGYKHLSDEEREFLEYVKKRIELAATEDIKPSIFIAVSGTDPRLPHSLRSVVPQNEEIISVVLTHPQKTDIEEIVDLYRGHTVSLEDRKQLFQYLRSCDSSTGAVVAGLKDALLKGVVTFSRGHWQFGSRPVSQGEVSGGATKTHVEYYQALLDGLDENQRKLLRWLSCHRGSIPADDLSRVSSMVKEQILNAAEALRPFRILETNRAGDVVTVALESESVRAALHSVVDPKFRQRAHEAYIRLYQSRLETAPSRGTAAEYDLYDRLSYHYEQTRDYERLFRVHLKIMRLLKSEARVYDIRELCAKGVAVTRRLRGKKWEKRRWHLERYYLKQWIENEWTVNNYKGIRDVVQSALLNRGRQLPASFSLKYCLSLYQLGMWDDIMSVLKYIRRRFKKEKSAPYVTTLILEAIVLCNKAEYERSNKLLSVAEGHSGVLNEYLRCEMYLFFVMNADRSGDSVLLERPLKSLEKISIENGFVNEYLIALFARFNVLFSRSKFDKAKTLARRAIAISVKSKLYNRQRDWYFQYSALYYEQGIYNKALKYIEKALQLATNLGLKSVVTDSLTRIGMIYQNMGQYGDAIRVVDRANRTVTTNTGMSIKTVLLLFWYDIHLSVRSYKRKSIKHNIDSHLTSIREESRKAYYYYLVGHHHLQIYEMGTAAKYFSYSRELNEQLDIVDDAIRAALSEATVHLGNDNYDGARRLMSYIGSRIKEISSKNIEAEYWILKLKYHYRARTDKAMLNKYAEQCEKMANKAYEIPTLLECDKILFRVKARLGEAQEARKYFKSYYNRVKKIVANLPSKEYAEAFLGDDDTKLIFKEYQRVKRSN